MFQLVWSVVQLFICSAGAETLNPMTYVTSSAGYLNTTFTVDKFFYDTSATTGAKFWTRVYNRASISGDILHPGPVLKFKRGDTVTVVLENNLGPETASLGANSINSFHYANVTNLHTHGLHISAESPQDNVLMTVDPGGSFTYIYNIPSDHAGGTFWYHAHHHGSTALQVGGGLLGAIIVEDDASEVPNVFLNMPELVLLFSHIPAHDLLNRYASVTGDALFSHEDNNVANGVEFTLVNGQYQPTASMVQGKWTRMRLIFSSLTTSLELQMTSNTIGCEWHLLAKDGIYVEGAPRRFGETVYMGPGNRVDVVMKCASSGNVILGTATMANIITIVVSSTADIPDIALPQFSPYRPDYLADVYTATTTTTFSLNFQGVNGGCTVNGNAWDGSTATGSMVTGSIQEWDVRGVNRHPFHIHVNSYQLSGVTSATDFFMAGDWHDVLYAPMGVTVDKYFFAVDSFVTKSVLHCHFLPHEDLGCMGYMQHTGTAGATTGLSGHGMSCLGTSTATGDGTAVYTSACDLVTVAPSSEPSASPTSVPSSMPISSPPSTVPTSHPSFTPTYHPSHTTSYQLKFQQELTGITIQSVWSSVDSFAATIAATLNVTQDSVTVNNVVNASATSTTIMKKVIDRVVSLSSTITSSVLVDYSVLTANSSDAGIFTSTLNTAVTSGQLLSDLYASSSTFAVVSVISMASYEGSEEIFNSPFPSSAPSLPLQSLSPTLLAANTDDDKFDFKTLVFIILTSVGFVFTLGVIVLEKRRRMALKMVQPAAVTKEIEIESSLSGVSVPAAKF